MTRTPGRNRDPRRLARHSGRHGPHRLDVPDLGWWTTTLRNRAEQTRTTAAQRLHISETNLKRIEREGGIPPFDTLQRIAQEYQLDDAQHRFTRELAQPARDLTPLAELRDRFTAPVRRAHLTRFDNDGIACAFLDPIWNVVAANKLFARAFPGVEDFDHNLALWHFQPGIAGPTSKQTVVFWDLESAFFVATLRGAFGRYRHSPQIADLLRKLERSPAFASLWTGNLAVTYGRCPDELVHLRDSSTGAPYSMSIHLGEVADARDVRLCIGYRQSYAGPPLR
ncbi:helix-turn-helix domain-containing protein [Nocardia wallacei]|uniref:MmyB family transcriptional regulator n=1 Tax=Nocardia wallacei TaxID=480035 RepID=UPI002454DD3E|nr:helix-turn-helix domain-containing protein [Nocardia wallacei]